MNRAAANIMDVLQEAVRTHAKGGDVTDEEIRAAMERTVPGTIAAVIKACVTGAWAPVPHKSLADDRQKMRDAAHAKAAPVAAVVVPPKKGK